MALLHLVKRIAPVPKAQRPAGACEVFPNLDRWPKKLSEASEWVGFRDQRSRRARENRESPKPFDLRD
jgi:hypothetical protein